MLNLLLAERLKWKRTAITKILWIAPLITLLLGAGLMGGPFFQTGTYNWWYTLLLPSALAMTCAFAIEKDRKLKLASILTLPIDLTKVWYSKIVACSIWLLMSTMVFFFMMNIGGTFFDSHYTLLQQIVGCFFIFFTMLWQIPVCLFLAAKFGIYIAILLNIVGTVIGVVFAMSKLWYLMPYSITPRMMVPLLHILPNGLPASVNSPLLTTTSLLFCSLIACLLFIALTFITALWFQKKGAIHQ